MTLLIVAVAVIGWLGIAFAAWALCVAAARSES